MNKIYNITLSCITLKLSVNLDPSCLLIGHLVQYICGSAYENFYLHSVVGGGLISTCQILTQSSTPSLGRFL